MAGWQFASVILCKLAGRYLDDFCRSLVIRIDITDIFSNGIADIQTIPLSINIEHQKSAFSFYPFRVEARSQIIDGITGMRFVPVFVIGFHHTDTGITFKAACSSNVEIAHNRTGDI